MKICFCIDTMEGGGAERVASVLCNEFANKGHSVVLLAVSEKEQNSFYSLNKKIAYVPLLHNCRKKRMGHLAKIKTLRRHFKANNYDATISFLPNVSTYVWLALIGNKGAIHIASERNNPKTNPTNPIKRFLKELSFKYADGVVFQTNEAREYFLHKIKCPSKVIFNPVFRVIESKNNQKTSNMIVSVGRLETQKNFTLLIDAFHDFWLTHPEATLGIYGTGKQKSELQKRISEYNLDNQVALLGESKTWLEDNLGSAMFINSSLYEGMPNALLEAMLSGIPCLSSDCPIGGSKELLSFENGLLFENNNKEDLVNKMNLLYHNDKLINSFRAANLKIKNIFSSDSISNQWLDFIFKITQKRS